MSNELRRFALHGTTLRRGARDARWELARSSFYHQRTLAMRPDRVLRRREPKPAWERRRTAREDPRSAVARAITHVPEDRESHAGTITAART
jgi:hypothetical protein